MSDMKPINFIDVTPAMEKAGVSRPTLIRWCMDLGIGLKIGGRWKVNEDKLDEVLKGERFYGQEI
ncbi:MAG: helix-turn-helix domain-containing protein [archaeon]|nr:helix-turn-helix domain-containing protein [archaeon]